MVRGENSGPMPRTELVFRPVEAGVSRSSRETGSATADFRDRKMNRSPGLGFFLFILLNATLFFRPHELIPEFGEPPIYNVIILACLAVSSSAVLRQLTSSSLSKDPIAACALCLLGSVVLSNLSHLRFGEAISSGIEFIKLLVYFLLLVALSIRSRVSAGSCSVFASSL